MGRFILLGLIGWLFISPLTTVAADYPETILLDGKIVTLDETSSVAEAIAVAGDRIAAVGPSADMRRLAGPKTRIVDLGGRTVIPGLIDSHIHAIRAGLHFATETSWIGSRTIPDAMDRVRTAAKQAGPGQWVVVAGGWTPIQFAERRRPSQAELAAAAPNNPVYVQLFYGAALMTPEGFNALGIATEKDLPDDGTFQRDKSGAPTGSRGRFRSLRRSTRGCRGPRWNRASPAQDSFCMRSIDTGLPGLSTPAGITWRRNSTKPCSDYGG